MDLERDLIRSRPREHDQCKQVVKEERSIRRRRKWQRRRLRSMTGEGVRFTCDWLARSGNIMTNQEMLAGSCKLTTASGSKRQSKTGNGGLGKSVPYKAGLVLLVFIGLHLFQLSGDNFNRENGNDNYRVPSCLAQAHELSSQDALETNRKTSATLSTSNQKRSPMGDRMQVEQQVSAWPRSSRAKRATHTGKSSISISRLTLRVRFGSC